MILLACCFGYACFCSDSKATLQATRKMVDASRYITMTCVSAYQHVNTWVQKVQCLENGVLSRCTVARIHLHWLLGFYSHLFQGSRIRKMAPTVEAQVPAKTKPCPQIRTPPNPTVASNLSLRRGPHLKYGPRDRDPRSTTRQTRASTVTQRFPRPKQIQTIPNFPVIPPHPQPVGPPPTEIFHVCCKFRILMIQLIIRQKGQEESIPCAIGEAALN